MSGACELYPFPRLHLQILNSLSLALVASGRTFKLCLEERRGDPARRGDHGWVRSSCRQRYAPVESSIAHHLREVIYDIYTAVNQDGRPILKQNSEERYQQIKARRASRSVLERAVPQHTLTGDAHPDWLAFRQEDPTNPHGARPINSSDLPIIFKVTSRSCTYNKMNQLLKFHQRRDVRSEFSEVDKQLMKWGSDDEEDESPQH